MNRPQEPAPASKKFGTFTGVFTPTLLTILGVIMYVRLGWVVGNAGLGGAMLIMGLGILITTCTGLSLSSIATNTRIGAGGSYAIMKRSLGLEVGGSIGIPLYLTRPLGVAMYIFGFREGLLWILPGAASYALLVDMGIFLVLFGIAYRSADLAFKTQFVIMALIGLSLISIFASPAPLESGVEIAWWGDYPGAKESGFSGTDFWGVFAVFFPATTGILAGADMSGDLKDPRRAIPVGTLAAIALASVIYFACAFWVAQTGDAGTLTENYTQIIDKSLVPELVLAGLLGATASSALAGLVGGPRILMAMGQDRIVPASDRLAALSAGGEPRNALVVTGVLTIAAIMVRDLNVIAPLVTMFFLITYCMINVVVLLESGLGLVSYRPTLQVPIVVPLFGLLGCLFSMFIVNPTFSLVSVAIVIALYFFIRRRNLALAGEGIQEEAREDVRSSVFVAFAEWAASKVTPEDSENVRAWKPHLLVPVEDVEELRGSFKLLVDLARPEGSVKLMGLDAESDDGALLRRLEIMGRAIREQGVLASWSVISLPGYTHAVSVGMMALQGAFFRPNLLFVTLAPDARRRDELPEVFRHALSIRVGVCLYLPHPSAGLGRQKDIRLWINATDTWNAHDVFKAGNLDLILLLGYRFWRLWRGRLELVTVAPDEEQRQAAARFLDDLCDLARFTQAVERRVEVGAFTDRAREADPVDLTILGLQREAPNLDWAERMVKVTRGSCLMVLDSGRESARA